MFVQAVGLSNATLTASEKGFYGMSFTLTIYAAVAVHKNTRDTGMVPAVEPPHFLD